MRLRDVEIAGGVGEDKLACVSHQVPATAAERTNLAALLDSSWAFRYHRLVARVSMYPIIIELGPVTIYSFGVMMALGFLASGYVVTKELGRKGLDPNLGSALVFWAAVGGLVGARLWVILDDFREFLAAPIDFIFSGAGFVWYGGLVGGLTAVTLFIRYHGLPWLVTADSLASAIPLGHAIGRVGCQLAGDGDWGKETTLPWGMAYPNAIIGWEYPPDVRVHPAPLYEALLYAAIFVVLWQLRPRLSRPGATLGAYFVLAAIARFLVEFVRIEPRVLWGLTEAQLFSGVLAAAGLALLARGIGASAVDRHAPGTAERSI
jgi:phosphatidylglycerol:prolipoprotein diacylglycerol transferase